MRRFIFCFGAFFFSFSSVFSSHQHTEAEYRELVNFRKSYNHVHLPFYDEIVDINRSFASNEEEVKIAHRKLFIPKDIKKECVESQKIKAELKELREFKQRYNHVHLPLYDDLIKINQQFAPNDEMKKKANSKNFMGTEKDYSGIGEKGGLQAVSNLFQNQQLRINELEKALDSQKNISAYLYGNVVGLANEFDKAILFLRAQRLQQAVSAPTVQYFESIEIKRYLSYQ